MEGNQSVIHLNDYKELLSLAKKSSTVKKPVERGSFVTTNSKHSSYKKYMPYIQRKASSNSMLNHQSNEFKHVKPTTLFSKTAISLMSTMMESQINNISKNIALHKKTQKNCDMQWQRMKKMDGRPSEVSIYCDPEVGKLCDVQGICEIIRVLDKETLRKSKTFRKRKNISIFSLPKVEQPMEDLYNSENFIPYYNKNTDQPIEILFDATKPDIKEKEQLIEQPVKKVWRKKKDDPMTMLEMENNTYNSFISISVKETKTNFERNDICEQITCTCQVQNELHEELIKLKNELANYKTYNDICERVRAMELYEHNLQEEIIRNQKILNDLMEERQKIEVEYLSIQDMVQTIELKCGNCKQLLQKKIQLEKQFNDIKYQINKAKRAKLKIKMEDKGVQNNFGQEQCKIVLKMIKRDKGGSNNKFT